MDVCVSSWNRMAPNTLPALSKAGANYMNSQLIKMEAVINGYDEGIALDKSGYISEGSGENIFVVRDGKILTPPLGASVLPGITRDSVLKLAEHAGIPVVEGLVPREMLYMADEVFFSGTAAEITPIRSVDRIQVGAGRRGADHRAVAEGVLRHRQRGETRCARLADAGPCSCRSPLGADCRSLKSAYGQPPPPRFSSGPGSQEALFFSRTGTRNSGAKRRFRRISTGLSGL